MLAILLWGKKSVARPKIHVLYRSGMSCWIPRVRSLALQKEEPKGAEVQLAFSAVWCTRDVTNLRRRVGNAVLG